MAVKQYAVLGLGSYGFNLAINLEKMGCQVIAVDASEERVQEISRYVSQAMCANIQEEELIGMLGASNLDGVIVAVSENLEVSILATMHAKELGAPLVIAKAKNDLHASILTKLGADMVTMPEREMGVKLAKVLATHNFADWIELSPDYSMVEVKLPEKWEGKCLRELNVRGHYGLNVVGAIKGQEVMVNLDPDEPLKDIDIIILIGENKVLNKFSKGSL